MKEKEALDEVERLIAALSQIVELGSDCEFECNLSTYRDSARRMRRVAQRALKLSPMVGEKNVQVEIDKLVKQVCNQKDLP
jgi:hypothetical protein